MRWRRGGYCWEVAACAGGYGWGREVVDMYRWKLRKNRLLAGAGDCFDMIAVEFKSVQFVYTELVWR